jgi:hypothetical protein
MFPEWAAGIAGIIAVVAVAQIVVVRMGASRWRASLRAGQHPGEPEVSRLTEELAEVQRRLAELEERVDFTERLLATQREKDRLAK